MEGVEGVIRYIYANNSVSVAIATSDIPDDAWPLLVSPSDKHVHWVVDTSEYEIISDTRGVYPT